MNKDDYQVFVTTDCWRIRRDAYMKRITQCEICQIPKQKLEVHHLTYERLGRELDDDLIGLCEMCHRAMHGFPNTERWAEIMRATVASIQSEFPRPKYKQVLDALAVGKSL